MPEKVEDIVERARKGKGPIARIVEERKNEALAEYEETRIKRLVAEEEAKIKELKRQGQPLDQGLATDFTSHIFQLAEVDPEKAKIFIQSLDQESMNKIAYLMAMEKDRAGAFLQLAKSSGTGVKDLVEIMKLMRSNGSTDLKGIAEIFKAGVEAAKANRPEGPGTWQQGIDYVHKTFVKPFQDTMNVANQQIIDAKLETIKASIPPSPQQWLQGIKAGAKELGLTEAGKRGEIDLKIEEMRQSHDIDMAQLRWEQQKFMLTQEAERDKWGAIQNMLSPITAMAAPEVRNALRGVGQQVGKSLQGTGGQGAGAPSGTKVASFTCPKCETELTVPVPPNAPEEIPIKCPKCGEVTKARMRGVEEPPPEEKPSGRTRLSYKMG